METSDLKTRGFSYVTDDKGEIKCVGKGSFGKANLVTDPHGQVFVAKEMHLASMSKKDRVSAENEVKLLRQLDHPFIIKFVDSFIDAQEVMFIIMEYADGGDLSQRLKIAKRNNKEFSETQVMLWFAQLCLALDHLHEKRILHRDLKAMNVFLTATGVVKLGDFGFSKRLKTQQLFAHTVCGTPYYFSPELCQGQAYSNKSDVWSLGVMLFEMANLGRPYEANSLQELMKKIVYGNYNPISDRVPDQVRRLIQALLQKKDTQRPSLTKILLDPYVQEYVNKLPALLTVKQHERRYPQASGLKPTPPSAPTDHQTNIRAKIEAERLARQQKETNPAAASVALQRKDGQDQAEEELPPIKDEEQPVTNHEMDCLKSQIREHPAEKSRRLVANEVEEGTAEAPPTAAPVVKAKDEIDPNNSYSMIFEDYSDDDFESDDDERPVLKEE